MVARYKLSHHRQWEEHKRQRANVRHYEVMFLEYLLIIGFCLLFCIDWDKTLSNFGY